MLRFVSAIALAFVLLLSACSSGPEPTSSQKQAAVNYIATEADYYSTGVYSLPSGPFNRSLWHCVPTGYVGTFDPNSGGNKFGEIAYLDTDGNGNYVVNATVSVWPSIQRRFGVVCTLWSSLASTGGQSPVAWHNVTSSGAVAAGASAFTMLPKFYPPSNTLCDMVGMGGPTTVNGDLSEVLLANGHYQLYTQTASVHGDQTRETFGRCWDFTNAIDFTTYNVRYSANGSAHSVSTPSNQSCGVTYVAGDISEHNGSPASYWWDPFGGTLTVASVDAGSTWPWVNVRCLARF